MATISSAGIGSGLDVNSIITQLMAIEQQPLTALQTKATTIQSTVSEYGKIKSAISTMRDLASKLASTTTWGQTTTNSTSSAVAAATNGSAAGTYSVEVQKLASVQTLATAVQPADHGAGRRHAAHRARHLGHRPDQLHGRRPARRRSTSPSPRPTPSPTSATRSMPPAPASPRWS